MGLVDICFGVQVLDLHIYIYQRQLGLGLEDILILLIYILTPPQKNKILCMWTLVSSPNSGLFPLIPKKYLYVSVGLWAEDPAPSETSQPEKKERDLKPIPSATVPMAEPEAEIPETPPSQPLETVPKTGSARLAEALQKRNAGSAALDRGAKPKAKGKPKAKPSLKRPAARSDVRPAKKPASASSSAGNLKKPKPKSQAKGSKGSKSTSAVKPKMTRTCVYSRAYHGAQSIWT